MQYGTFEATVKSAPVGGAVTAIILIADGGDEIDFELLGGKVHYNIIIILVIHITFNNTVFRL
jgi:beta-glucanase (GH16 family)